MTNFDPTTVFMVDYETDTALVREYMSNIDYSRLLQSEKNGGVRIMNHEVISFADRKAA